MGRQQKGEDRIVCGALMLVLACNVMKEFQHGGSDEAGGSPLVGLLLTPNVQQVLLQRGNLRHGFQEGVESQGPRSGLEGVHVPSGRASPGSLSPSWHLLRSLFVIGVWRPPVLWTHDTMVVAEGC